MTKLAAMSGFRDPAVLACITGSEAIEASLKVARAKTGRRRIAALRYGFHGKTTGSLKLTWRNSFRSFAGIDEQCLTHLPVSYSNTSDCGLDDARALELIEQEFDQLAQRGDPLAAVVVEPIQVSEGVLILDQGYLEQLVRMCRRHNTVVIFDEIYTGLGRCGHAFRCQDINIMPDLLVVGKVLGNGFPSPPSLASLGFWMLFRPVITLQRFQDTLSAALRPTRSSILWPTPLPGTKPSRWAANSRLSYKDWHGKPGAVDSVRCQGLLVAFEHRAAKSLAEAALDEGVVLRTGGTMATSSN